MAGGRRHLIGVLAVLAVTQIVGWGTVSLLAVLGRQIAADLALDIATIFAGNSLFYVAIGLCSPVLAKAFAVYGARVVMIAGTLLAVPAFLGLAGATGAVTYFAAWLALGVAGAATLTTPAYILLNEVVGSKARSAIGALMLATGLSSSIFWPVTASVADMVGWRGTCLIFAALMGLVCLPLYLFALPRQRHTAPPAAAAASAAVASPAIFLLIVAAIALNAFITFGLQAILIELLQAEGLPLALAVAYGSALGIVQVCARGLDFVGGRRWDGISSGIAGGMALAAALMLLLATGGAAGWAVGAFILIYGLGSGVLAVARATIPLVFYDKAAFARASARIALPLNLMSAAAPPVLAGLLFRLGSSAVLILTLVISCLATAILIILRRRRPLLDGGGIGSPACDTFSVAESWRQALHAPRMLC